MDLSRKRMIPTKHASRSPIYVLENCHLFFNITSGGIVVFVETHG